MTQGKPSIVVVDDDPTVLRSLTRLLAAHGCEVTPFLSPASLLAEIDALAPRCVVADLSMPGLNGLELQMALAADGLDYPIVFVTGHGDVRSSVQAMRAGAVDFLSKPFEAAELLEAVHRALDRGDSLRKRRDRLAPLRQKLAQLTQRERQVFEQVVAGYLNKQIAANLGIAEKTVKVHRASVMRKMSARSVVELGRMAEQIRAS